MTDVEEDPERALSDNERNWADVVAGMRRAAVERFNVRRELEWRVSLTLWGGLALAANAFRGDRLTPGGHWKWILVVVGAVLTTVLHGVWEGVNVAPAARRDRNDGVDLDNELRTLLHRPPVDAGDYRAWVAHGWQVGVTSLLGVFLVIAATR